MSLFSITALLRKEIIINTSKLFSFYKKILQHCFKNTFVCLYGIYKIYYVEILYKLTDLSQMSHWRGTWRKKEFESVEKRVIKKT